MSRLLGRSILCPHSLGAAARFVLGRPRDAALLSMREQARQGGVQPATMTRFARHLGMEGYDRVREIYAAAVRDGDLGFADKADGYVASRRLKGDKAVAAEILSSIGRQIDRLAADGLDRLVAVAVRLASARHVYCLGLRSSHAVTWHMHYVLTLISDRPVVVDSIAATGSDTLAKATRQDPLVVTSVLPDTRLTVELAEGARGAAPHRRTSRGARHPPQTAIRQASRDENLTART
jgi:DNA-binding MurR/RpiR family transcriptional regulator